MMVKSIMLIDDDFDDAELFAEALSETANNIEFTHFDDGRTAVETLARSSRLPDLLFLDINLPSFSGWQCLTEIKKHDSLNDLYVIMYTTSTVEREKEIAKDLGASGFITKPQSYVELKKILKGILSLQLDNIREKSLF